MNHLIEHAAPRRGGAVRAALLASGLVAGAGSLAEAADRSHATEGIASFYGRAEHGGPTASGERFNMNALTAAHRTLPLGTRVVVTNLANGRAVTVRINDRGPFVRGRVIDLSHAAAGELGFVGAGLTRVHIATAGAETGRAEAPAPKPSEAPRAGADDLATGTVARPARHARVEETTAPAGDGRIRLSERDRLLIERAVTVD